MVLCKKISLAAVSESIRSVIYISLLKTICLFSSFDFKLLISSVNKPIRQQIFNSVYRNFTSDNQISASIHLMRSYVENNRSIARTAEELFIHKNTVQTQLNRIYERTGYNPRDSKDLTLLYATTHMYEMGPAWKAMRNKRISDQQRSLKDGTHICNNGSVKNQDKKCKNPTSQSFTSRYILYEKQGPERNSYAYGLLRQERHADRWVTVAITAPFSNNKPSLMQFAAHCTESQLNSIHLLDALHDFIDAEARTH